MTHAIQSATSRLGAVNGARDIDTGIYERRALRSSRRSTAHAKARGLDDTLRPLCMQKRRWIDRLADVARAMGAMGAPANQLASGREQASITCFGRAQEYRQFLVWWSSLLIFVVVHLLSGSISGFRQIFRRTCISNMTISVPEQVQTAEDDLLAPN